MSLDPTLHSALTSLGWSPFFSSSLEALGDASLVPARVSEEHRDVHMVLTGAATLRADVSARLRHSVPGREHLPAVGDWVAV